MKNNPKKKKGKIQSREMMRDIKNTRAVTEAWSQGGKAIGEILKPKRKKK